MASETETDRLLTSKSSTDARKGVVQMLIALIQKSVVESDRRKMTTLIKMAELQLSARVKIEGKPDLLTVVGLYDISRMSHLIVDGEVTLYMKKDQGDFCPLCEERGPNCRCGLLEGDE